MAAIRVLIEFSCCYDTITARADPSEAHISRKPCTSFHRTASCAANELQVSIAWTKFDFAMRESYKMPD
ncbi:MAG: hypothetical protein PHY54_00080 [Methylococcales bacterium]|nr:hypothetical protein [Methylococcales bacterium]